MQAIITQTGECFFIEALCGTGKTFLITFILAKLRSHYDFAFALASSGISTTLLDGGRTAHFALKMPLNMHITDTPICNISKSSRMGKVLRLYKFIIWDECTMAHKMS